MAKSNSEVLTYDNIEQENDGQNDDQQATTSKGAALKPGNTFDNMRDLEAIEFNSADTVRQAMKAIYAGKIPPPFREEVTHSHGEGAAAPIKINELARSHFYPIGQYIRSVNPSGNLVTKNRVKKSKKETDNWGSPGPSKVKRRGRPKGRSNKKMQCISDMYLGKLSNVVPFWRERHIESDSDVESAAFC